MDQFILFGDSISQRAFDQQFGYAAGAALSNAYLRKLDVVNRGFSGYNSSQGLVVLPRILPPSDKAKVRFLTIFFGANDARLPNTPGGPQQYVPLGTYKHNLKCIAMHQCLRAHKDLRLILITPPPIDERKTIIADGGNPDDDRHPPPRRTAENAARYAQAVQEVGEELDVAVLDLWRGMMDRAGYRGRDRIGEHIPGCIDEPSNSRLRDYLRDGLHLSASGYQVMFDDLMALIKSRWPDQMPERLPFYMPMWDDVERWKREGVDLRPGS